MMTFVTDNATIFGQQDFITHPTITDGPSLLLFNIKPELFYIELSRPFDMFTDWCLK